jgi:hypothetical protein
MKIKKIGSNRTEVETNNKLILISYETPVAVLIRGKGFFRTSKKWSATTTQHINQWIHSQLVGVPVSERPQEFFDNLLDN